MKRAFMSELAIVRTLVPSIAGVGLFIFVVLTLANASDGDSGMSAGACAVSAMSPIMVMSSLAGFDNQNGWERYRATLSLSRKDIICARYLSVIVFSALMACAATLLSIAPSRSSMARAFLRRDRRSLKSQSPRQHRCSSPS